jgi:hypothetical protein
LSRVIGGGVTRWLRSGGGRTYREPMSTPPSKMTFEYCSPLPYVLVASRKVVNWPKRISSMNGVYDAVPRTTGHVKSLGTCIAVGIQI